MVVNRHRQLLLGLFLANDILIEKSFDFSRTGQLGFDRGNALHLVFFQNRIADRYTLVTDVSSGMVAGGRDQFSYCILRFLAKRTTKYFF
jgi:hypothetical protein